jgi:hypothetical protein
LLMHFGAEQTQTALLVRLDESERPESDEPASASDASRGKFRVNLPGLRINVGNGVQVQAPAVNVDTSAEGTRVSAPGVEVQR